jgi:nucleotide-binding universal stress UspA family protein
LPATGFPPPLDRREAAAVLGHLEGLLPGGLPDRVRRLAPALRSASPFSHVLVGLDGSDGGGAASTAVLDWAAWLARQHRARLTLACVGAPAGSHPEDAVLREQAADPVAILEAGVRELRRRGVEAAALALQGLPSDELAKAATRLGVDLVLLGTHGHGRSAFAGRGGVAEGLLNASPASVLVARAPPGVRPVLAPVDGSMASLQAAALAIALAQQQGTACSILHVAEAAPPPHLPRRKGRRSQRKEDLAALGGAVSYQFAKGDAANEVAARAARLDAGLVVLGSRGRGGLVSLRMGSVCSRVAANARTSVLVTKARSE